MNKEANSGEATWHLITEGVTSARVTAHRLRKLLEAGQALIEQSPKRDHFFQVAGDLIMAWPGTLDALERDLDRTAYALAKVGEDHLKERLPLSDRALVEDGVENAGAFGRYRRRTAAERVARRYRQRQGMED